MIKNQLNFAALRGSRNGPLVDEAGLQARGWVGHPSMLPFLACQAVKYPQGLPGFFYKQTKDIRYTKVGKYEYRQPTRKCWYSGVCMLVCPDPPDIFFTVIYSNSYEAMQSHVWSKLSAPGCWLMQANAVLNRCFCSAQIRLGCRAQSSVSVKKAWSTSQLHPRWSKIIKVCSFGFEAPAHQRVEQFNSWIVRPLTCQVLGRSDVQTCQCKVKAAAAHLALKSVATTSCVPTCTHDNRSRAVSKNTALLVRAVWATVGYSIARLLVASAPELWSHQGWFRVDVMQYKPDLACRKHFRALLYDFMISFPWQELPASLLFIPFQNVAYLFISVRTFSLFASVTGERLRLGKDANRLRGPGILREWNSRQRHGQYLSNFYQYPPTVSVKTCASMC